jgi:hypothetical protein
MVLLATRVALLDLPLFLILAAGLVLAVFSLLAGFTALLLPSLLVALRGFFIAVVPSAGADLPALAILRGLPVLLLLAPLAEPLATLSALFFPERAGSCVLPTFFGALDALAPFI